MDLEKILKSELVDDGGHVITPGYRTVSMMMELEEGEINAAYERGDWENYLKYCELYQQHLEYLTKGLAEDGR